MPYHSYVSPKELEVGYTTPEQSADFDTFSTSRDPLGYDVNFDAPLDGSEWDNTPAPTDSSPIVASALEIAVRSHDQRHTQRRRPQRPSAIIKEWYIAHGFRVYPTSDQIQALVTLSGLSTQQVKQCLSNLRARNKSDIMDSARLQPARVSHRGSAIEQSSSAADALALIPPSMFDTYHANTSPDRYSFFHLSSHSREAAQSLVPVSAPFPQSNVPTRKGRRYHPSRFSETTMDMSASSPSKSSDSDLEGNIYKCTACHRSFKDNYGWKRHESGVHGYTDTEWVCMLNQIAVLGSKCFFCSETVISMEHFDIHDIRTCLDKDICERTFIRKDLLKQHIQQMHRVSKAFQVPKAWSQKVDSSRINQQGLWCGFCLTIRSSITERMDHVAKHFRDGHKIESWKAPVDCGAA